MVGVHASAPDQGLLAWAEAQSFGNLGRRDDGAKLDEFGLGRTSTRPRSPTWPTRSTRPIGLLFVGAYGGLRIGELAALRRSRVDFAAGTVDVAETVNELKGKLVVGSPKTRASRRKVSLPLRVMKELADHLRAPGRPTDQVFKAQGGRRWPTPT